MPVAPLTLRIPKGSPLTPVEMDTDLEILRDFSNSLEQLVLALFNPDGTLIANSVNTAAIQNRAVTLAKLAFRSIFYYVDTGLANAMVLTTGSGALTAYASGIAFWVQAAANNNGATTCNVDGLGPRTVKKIAPSGLVALALGDIIAGGLYLLVDDGVELVLLNPTLPVHGLVTNKIDTDTDTLAVRAGSTFTTPHTGTKDTVSSVHWTFLCISDDGGYKAADVTTGADELDMYSVTAQVGGGPPFEFYPPMGAFINDLNLGCAFDNHGGILNAPTKDGTTSFNMDTTKWKIRVRWIVSS